MAIALVVLVVALLIGEIAVDAAHQSPKVGRRATSSWIAGIEPILATSSAVALALGDLERSPDGLTVVKVSSVFSALSGVLRDDQRSLGDLGIKPPSARAETLVVRLLAQRVAASEDLRGAVVAATELPHRTTTAQASCLRGQVAVRDGDAAWAQLRRTLPKADTTDFATFSSWASSLPRLGASGCAALVSALGANQALVPRAELTVAAISVQPNPVQINGVPNPTTTTLPAGHPATTTVTTTTSAAVLGTTTTTTTTTTTLPPVTTTTLQIPPPQSRSVLPPTTTITVEVVVQNSGNQGMGPVHLSVELTMPLSRLVVTRSRTTAGLAPDGARYVAFGPIPLGAIQGRFTLTVTASGIGAKTVERSVSLVRSPRQ